MTSSNARTGALPRLALLGTAAVTALGLGACASRDMSDLRDWVSQTRARPGGRIEPLPEIKSYDSYAYAAQGLRSPFQPDTEIAPPSAVVDTGPRPDPNRNKEYLENFPLDSLRMVGTLKIEGRTFALVRDGDGLVHQVLPGQYLGQNDGKVERITEAEIEVRELVPNGLGGYLERQSAVALAD